MPRPCASITWPLQALERQQPVDDAQRCTLLLALGEAQPKAGEHPRALATPRRAPQRTRPTVGARKDWCVRRLESEHTVWIGGPSRRTCRTSPGGGTEALGRKASALRARILGRLARCAAASRAARTGGGVAHQAVEWPGAWRPRLYWPSTLRSPPFPGQPEATTERLAYATEMLRTPRRLIR